ncbi:cyclase family protein [Streptomyces sp. 1331.2]|uniref:cyclase family protein n=1 Tax=Streptomyces sp. 1331.2 TaxID=1938835 RepID=UPI000BCC3E53|nr:cyclase family protein [Streptomyces sp. 1331.2]SOB84172.1 Kynurenine formamidase [Streptomyces sp. 1331.2]
MCSPETVAGATAHSAHLATAEPAVEVSAPIRARTPVALPGGAVRDLTHVVGPDWPVFELYVKPMEIKRLANLAEHEYNAFELTYNEHIGTHLDAPSHFDDNGLATHQIPADTLVAPLAVVRIGERAARDNVTELTVDDLLRWESRNGRIPDGALLAVDNDWAHRIHTPGAFLNLDPAEGLYRFPGISVEAAQFLVTERSVVGVGTDSISLDPGTRPADPDTHRVLLPAGKYAIECLAGLDTVPDLGAVAVVGAPKHLGGTGGPVRVLAFV